MNERVEECLYCAENAHCTNTVGYYLCTCNAGYTGDGVSTCTDIDECSLGVATCGANADCVNTDGSYDCVCRPGFTGNEHSVCTNIDECEKDSVECGSNAQCVDTEGIYTCVCNPGYIRDDLVGCLNDDSSKVNSENNELNLVIGCTMAALGMAVIVCVTAVLLTVKYYRHRRVRKKQVETPPHARCAQQNADRPIQQGASLTELHYPAFLYNEPHYEGLTQADLREPNNQPHIYGILEPSPQEYSLPVPQHNPSQEHFYENTSPYHDPETQEERLYVQIRAFGVREMSKRDICVVKHLGSGEFGSVNRGVWTCERGELDVAVKTLTDSANTVKFLQEAAIMAQFRHPNVILLHGLVYTDNPKMLVMELMHNGDLKTFLESLRPEPGKLVSDNVAQSLLDFSQQVAFGMSYLASKGFIHRDLAARNVLVSKHHTCKIADFGMSRDLADEDYYVSHGGKIPVKWTAPEALHYRKYSTASDVWSYGCVLYEIWSLGHKPFQNKTNIEALHLIKCGNRLHPPPGCSKVMYESMIQCWHPEASQRPDYKDVVRSWMTDKEAALVTPREEVADGHSEAGVLGAPLEAGQDLYTDLQNRYL